MKEYNYEIIHINETERWIYLFADEWDCEETDSFVFLVKKISVDLNGKITGLGMCTYSIDKDPFRLVYQWESLFGITIVYPEDVEKEEVIKFLEKYF